MVSLLIALVGYETLNVGIAVLCIDEWKLNFDKLFWNSSSGREFCVIYSRNGYAGNFTCSAADMAGCPTVVI
jgi:hypothetical protein